MNEHERQNAVEKIDGYFFPRPNEGGAAAFERAQAECLMHLRRQLANVEAVTLQQFREVRRPNKPNVEAA